MLIKNTSGTKHYTFTIHGTTYNLGPAEEVTIADNLSKEAETVISRFADLSIEYGDLDPVLIPDMGFIDTDNTLAADSDLKVASQKAIKAYIAALGSPHSHANKTTLDAIEQALTTALKSAYDGAVSASHAHTNKATLDAVEEAFTTALKSAYDGAVSDSHAHTNKATLDAVEEAFTTALKSAYDGAVSDSHTHTNKATLDAVEEAFTTALKSAYDGAVSDSHTHTNKATLDAVEEAFTTALKSAYDGAVSDAHTHTNKTDLDAYDPAVLQKKTVKATYNFATMGGTVGTISLAVLIPDNAVITRTWLEIITPMASALGNATIAVQAEGAGDVLAAIDADTLSGFVDGIQVGAAANFIKMTSAKNISAVIAVEDLTAGKFSVVAEYVVTE